SADHQLEAGAVFDPGLLQQLARSKLRQLAASGPQSSSAPAQPDAGTATPSQIGPYRLLELLGRGGMGVVWRAQHLRSGAVAALKTVGESQPMLLESLRREIRALARLRHPGI